MTDRKQTQPRENAYAIDIYTVVCIYKYIFLVLGEKNNQALPLDGLMDMEYHVIPLLLKNRRKLGPWLVISVQFKKLNSRCSIKEIFLFTALQLAQAALRAPHEVAFAMRS